MMCPYGRRVMAMPKAYRDRGTRIFIFAGDAAWPRAREYIEDGEIYEARSRYVLVAPTSMPDRDTKQEKRFKPYNCNWPVSGFSVVVIDCEAGEQLLTELTMAIRRDGAAEAKLVPHPDPVSASRLRVWQPWFPQRADWWDTELQPPFGTGAYWQLVAEMEHLLNTCELNDEARMLMAEFKDADSDSAGYQALCLAWQDGRLRDRLIDSAKAA